MSGVPMLAPVTGILYKFAKSHPLSTVISGQLATGLHFTQGEKCLSATPRVRGRGERVCTCAVCAHTPHTAAAASYKAEWESFTLGIR